MDGKNRQTYRSWVEDVHAIVTSSWVDSNHHMTAIACDTVRPPTDHRLGLVAKPANKDVPWIRVDALVEQSLEHHGRRVAGRPCGNDVYPRSQRPQPKSVRRVELPVVSHHLNVGGPNRLGNWRFEIVKRRRTLFGNAWQIARGDVIEAPVANTQRHAMHVLARYVA